MSVVALIGADGAGKTTVARQLEKQLSMRVKYLYMGGHPDHSSLLLPTTRLRIALRRWRDIAREGADAEPGRGKMRRALYRGLASVLDMLLFAAGLAEEWWLQAVILNYKLRGFVVVLDRHFLFHHHAYIVGGTKGSLPLGTRIHAFMLEHLYPRPDLVIYLDAAPEVLFARKGEKTIEILYQLREKYLEMSDRVRHFVVVDANQPQDEVVFEAVKIVSEFCGGQFLHERQAGSS